MAGQLQPRTGRAHSLQEDPHLGFGCVEDKTCGTVQPGDLDAVDRFEGDLKLARQVRSVSLEVVEITMRT